MENKTIYLFTVLFTFSLFHGSLIYAQSDQSIMLTADKTEGEAPLRINVQAELKNFRPCANTYVWDFGDGPAFGVADSCYYIGDPIPSRIITNFHNYNNLGTYEVKLKVNNVVSNSIIITVRVGANVVAPPPPPLPPPLFYRFYRNLTIGSYGEDVMALQKFLNRAGVFVALSGYGSPNNETFYFGRLTRAALAKWQAMHGIFPSVGYFGIKTRTAINIEQ